MSKVKTRKEINEELTALHGDIANLQADHAAKVTALESTVENLTAELEQAKEAITAADTDMTARVEEVSTLTASLGSIKAELTAEQEARAETEAGLEKAKAALANPAFVDAAIVPHSVDQSLADAEADEAEAKAEKKEAEAKSIQADDFLAMSPEDQNSFFRNGGKIAK